MGLSHRGFNYIKNYFSPDGRGPVVMDFPFTDTSATVGDLLVLSSGRATAAAANLTTVFAVAYETFTGGTAGDLRKVALIQPGQVWGCLVDGAAIALSVVGTRTINVTNAYTVDTTPTTGGSLIFVGRDATTTTIAHVMFDKIAFAPLGS